MGRPKRKGLELTSVVHNNVKYEPGDCVLINPDGAAQPFIGRIKHFFAGRDNEDVTVEVTWFYRPEEAVGGRKDFHGAQELFDSDHLDHVHKNTILSKCNVLTLAEYERLESVADYDFFYRFKYKPQSSEFEPDRVPVYCLCESPYNPDRQMLMCDTCNEWYHVSCLHLSQEETRRFEDERSSYCCQQCLGQAPHGPPRTYHPQYIQPASQGAWAGAS